MSENKHTPGPWVAKTNAAQGEHKWFICNPGYSKWPIAVEMSKGDAMLAAAAPDMLDALEEAIGHWEYDNAGDKHPYRKEWADKAKAAIAKARGEI